MELRKVKCFKELNIVGFLVEKRQYWELSQLKKIFLRRS